MTELLHRLETIAVLVFLVSSMAAMGLTQCTSAQHGLRLAYLGAFALVIVYAETPVVHTILAGLAP